MKALKLAKVLLVEYLTETIKNKDSAKAQKAKKIVTEVRDACNQFLDVFAEE
jgi:hypothetical protein